MTVAPQVERHPEIDPVVRNRSLLVAARLMLGANVSVQLSFLFAYLYLRANNFDGMWHPDGVGAPPMGLAVAALLILAVAAVAVWVAAQGVRPDGTVRAATGALLVALVAGVACIGVRVFQMTHFNWTPDQGAYVDISILWYAVIAAEVVIGCLWLIKLTAGHVRATVPLTRGDVRSAAEYWLFVTAAALGVFLLVQFVT